MLSRLLLLWMRPLMRRSEGLPWTVLTEEAAVMEPAVGLGWILEGNRRKRRRRRKNKNITSGQVSPHHAQLFLSGTKEPQARPGKRRRDSTVTFLDFQKATVPRWIKWHLKKSIIGFNVTAALQGSWCSSVAGSGRGVGRRHTWPTYQQHSQEMFYPSQMTQLGSAVGALLTTLKPSASPRLAFVFLSAFRELNRCVICLRLPQN